MSDTTVQIQATAPNQNAPIPKGLIAEFWSNFSHNKGAVVGLAYIILIFTVSLLADFVAPYDPIAQARDALLMPPAWLEGGSWSYILGTDDVGRDILSRLIYGARLSLFIGLFIVCLSFLLGVTLGLISGYFGGMVDTLIMRLVDIIPEFIADHCDSGHSRAFIGKCRRSDYGSIDPKLCATDPSLRDERT